MPKFDELYAANKQPFRIRVIWGGGINSTATVDGDEVKWDASGALVSAVSAATYEWELYQPPTAESVFRERGYIVTTNAGDWRLHHGDANRALMFRCDYHKRPTTAEKATIICNALDLCK